jgi:hypothetical protein
LDTELIDGAHPRFKPGCSVSAHLEHQHHVRIAAGKKGMCPFCRHETFSIRKDDSIGKCFHSTCGRAITSGSLAGDYQGSLYEILDQIKHDFHTEIGAQKGKSDGYAYQYLRKNRQIHEQVIFDLWELGAVPRGYDVGKVFAPHFAKIADRQKELLDKIQASQERRLEAKEERKDDHKQGKQKATPSARSKTEQEKAWEKEHERLDKQRAFLEEQQRKLSELLPTAASWIALFHTDQFHRVRSIRFRKAEGRYFQSYVPFKGSTGVFGHSLFRQYSGKRQAANRLLLVEGEINLLQIHSLALRTATEVSGKSSPHYANWIAATGSANTIDKKVIGALLNTPGAVKPLVVCQDNDEAGDGMVQELLQTFTLELVTPPVRDQDIDDYIRGFGGEHHKALASVEELIRLRRRLFRPHEAVAKEIYRTRQKQGEDDTRREFEIHAQVKDIVLADSKERGKFYCEHQRGYFFHEEKKRLIPLDDHDKQVTLMLERYGLNAVEKTCEYVQEALFTESLNRGTATRVHRLAWFDSVTHVLYLNNHDDQIYRITEDAIELVDNGTDGVLFLSDPRNEPFELVHEEDLGNLFHELVTEEINFEASDRLTLAEQRLIFDHWFYSIFFGSIMPTRPILTFIGPKGSGKSYTLKRIGILLFGSRFGVQSLPSKEDDFDAIVTNTHYAAFDNADSKVKWLPDRLAVCATGGTVSKRVLYTTNQLADFPIDCFLGITSRTPHFNRDDVADRLLIGYVKRFETNQFRSENELKAAILQQRNRILTAVVRHLQECLAALKQSEGKTYRTSFRMADFAVFCLRLADAKGTTSTVEDIFAKMQNEQAAFTLEGDSLVDLLEAWLQVKETRDCKITYPNQGREVTAKVLHRELSALAEAKGLTFGYHGGQALGQRIRHIETNLRTLFEVVVNPDGAKNQKTYQFSPLIEEKAEPQPVEVESGGIDDFGDSTNASYLDERF